MRERRGCGRGVRARRGTTAHRPIAPFIIYSLSHLTAALHTILFCRLLGACSPVDGLAEAYGLSYVGCVWERGENANARSRPPFSTHALSIPFSIFQATVGDPEVASTVSSKAASIAAWADRHRGHRAGVRLRFFEGGTAPPPATAPWEAWVLPLAISPLAAAPAGAPAADDPPLGRGRPGLEAVLLAAATAAAARPSVPPVLTPAVATFPFSVDLLPSATSGKASNSNNSSAFGTVKRLLLQASPPSVLN